MSSQDRKRRLAYLDKITELEYEIQDRDERGDWKKASRRNMEADIALFEKYVDKYEKRILKDDIKQDNYYGRLSYALENAAKDVSIVDDMRRSSNFQTRLANKIRSDNYSSAIRDAMYSTGLDLATRNQIYLDEMHRVSDAITMDNPRLPTKVPFKDRKDEARYAEVQARTQRDMDLQLQERMRRSGESSMANYRARRAAEQQTLHEQAAAAKFEAGIRTRVNPPTVRQIMAAQLTAGGLGNIGEYNPLTDQEMLDAGYMITRQQARDEIRQRQNDMEDYVAAQAGPLGDQLPDDWEELVQNW